MDQVESRLTGEATMFKVANIISSSDHRVNFSTDATKMRPINSTKMAQNCCSSIFVLSGVDRVTPGVRGSDLRQLGDDGWWEATLNGYVDIGEEDQSNDAFQQRGEAGHSRADNTDQNEAQKQKQTAIHRQRMATFPQAESFSKLQLIKLQQFCWKSMARYF